MWSQYLLKSKQHTQSLNGSSKKAKQFNYWSFSTPQNIETQLFAHISIVNGLCHGALTPLHFLCAASVENSKSQGKEDR
jgi:hypothetical protein